LPGQSRMRLRYRALVGEWFDFFYVGPHELDLVLGRTPWRVERLFTKEKQDSYAMMLSKTRSG
jgi:hypothetical protein